MDIDQLLQLLDGVRKSGSKYLAKCPAHADRSPSLSIAEGDDGRILLHCFAGCTAVEIADSMGLELKDLFPKQDLSPQQRKLYRYFKSRRQAEDLLMTDIMTLQQVLYLRELSRQKAKGKCSHEDYYPQEPWERERVLAKRICTGLEALYD